MVGQTSLAPRTQLIGKGSLLDIDIEVARCVLLKLVKTMGK